MGPETYTFTAKVIGRAKDRIDLSPENPDMFMDYLVREGLPLSRYYAKGSCVVSIRNSKVIDAAGSADRVRYTVKKLGKRLIGIKLEPAF